MYCITLNVSIFWCHCNLLPRVIEILNNSYSSCNYLSLLDVCLKKKTLLIVCLHKTLIVHVVKEPSVDTESLCALRALSLWTIFTADILICQRRRSTTRIYKVNNGCMPLRRASSRALVLCMPTHCHDFQWHVLEWCHL